MNPLFRFYFFILFAISIVFAKDFNFLFPHIFFTFILIFYKKSNFIAWKIKIKKVLTFIILSSLFFFLISSITSDKSLLFTFKNVMLATIKILILISLMIIYLLQSKSEDLISALKSISYKYSFKNLFIERSIIYFDLTIRFYPNILNQMQTLIRSQKSLSNDKIQSPFKKISLVAKNIPDLILINLIRTEKITQCMKMRGYGSKKGRSSFPYYYIKTNDYISLFFLIVTILVMHLAF